MAEQDEHALISDLLAEVGHPTAAVHDGHRAQRGCGDVFAVHLGDARLALDLALARRGGGADGEEILRADPAASDARARAKRGRLRSRVGGGRHVRIVR